MHIKFSKTGNGKAGGLAQYLLSEKDSKGEIREDITVLRNDPIATAELAESLEFKNKHKHAIIAFSKADNPTDKQINAVLDDFEQTAFAGLDKNQYSWSAVQHVEEDGAKHIHIIVANVELETGKAMNIAPPGWQKWTDPIRDKHNLQNGWDSPDIEQYPDQARLIQPDFRAYLEKKTARDQIESYLYQGIEAGKVENRADIIDSLKEVGFKIPRAGKNYITAHDPDSGVKIRLKGALFNESWRVERENISKNERERNQARATDTGRIERLQQEIDGKIQKRAKYNQERYKGGSKGNIQSPKEAEQLIENDKVSMVAANIDNGRDLGNGGKLRSNKLPAEEINESQERKTNDRTSIKPKDKGNQIFKPTQTNEPDQRSGSKRPDQTQQPMEEKGKNLRGGGIETELERTIKETRTMINDSRELERFKTDINLPAYMAQFDYKLNTRHSSRNSFQMEKEGEKLIVATDTDGHGIFFSRDGSRSGSVIDFHQSETGDNLGKTRQALRGVNNSSSLPPQKEYRKPSKASTNTTGVIKSLATMRDGESGYLSKERGISPTVQQDPRFSGVIKTDRRNNAVFPHYDENGVTGYELKNKGFTGFSRGGTKSLWRSTNFNSADKVVITESAIDALSHAQLKGTGQETAYISAGGSIGKEQEKLLVKLLKDKDKVVLAFDNDKAGKEMAEDLKKLLRNTERERPTNKDWNEDLKVEQLSERQKLIREYKISQAQKELKAEKEDRSMGR